MSYGEPEAAYAGDEERSVRRPQRNDGRHTVEEHLEQLDREVMILAEVIDRAGTALAPVMRPEPPSPPDSDLAVVRPEQSAVGDRIESATARVRSRTRKLGELLDRLDL